MNSGINMERVKKENRSLILKYINDKGPVSRVDIAEATGLTAASVTQITTALIKEKLLLEVGVSPENTGTAGRKKILLDFNPDAAWIISVNIESETTTVAICNSKGDLVGGRIRQIPTDKKAGSQKFLFLVADICINLATDLKPRQRKHLTCISVGIPGIVDKENGISVHAYGIWKEPVEVAKIITERTSLPVILDNNVNAFSTAEILFGTGRNFDSLLVIKWGPGVGSTIVVNKKVYEGRHGKTAELGHFIVEKGGKKCSCGRRGCLETLLSYKELQKTARFLPENFGKVYEESKGAVRKSFDNAIDLFARSIVNTGTIIAPNRIVLSGSLFGSAVVRDKLIECCKEYDPAYNENRICYTALSDKESYIGPVAVYLERYLYT
ncbi:ROK family transcriptional regulator [Butyrivibrio sp. FCS014]|uniref:ROK family transcriptional regulator n=1 Tax=Butyrivibrio sp. FCS014 TaxID=1408304 RepID=UPI0004655F04|nr:ROK family transcriptional regulator [Butyrivibrio sp. FCS014]